MRGIFVLFAALLVMTGGSGYAQTTPAQNSGGQFMELDHVVAVINGSVLLQSDVDAEMHFSALEPFRASASEETPQRAMRRLINRALIVQQMKEQQQYNANISDAEAEKSLKEERAHLPACAKYDCGTEAGWKAFLKANDLTEQEVLDHWKQRTAILQFIDQRFRTGIRISQASIEDYYTKTVVPVFEKQHENPPLLKDISARIQQVLLQQQVNGMLQDWLRSLRDEGSVRIIDPRYASAAETRQTEGKSR